MSFGEEHGHDRSGREEARVEESTSAAIRAANAELTERAGSLLELPLVVLTEQRDRLMRRVEDLKLAVIAERSRLMAEQDAFIADLMAEHEQARATYEQELASLSEQLERREALLPMRTGTTDPAMPAVRGTGTERGAGDADRLDEQERQVAHLKEQLVGAYSEVDEARADAFRLQEELDAAVAAVNDARYQMYDEIEKARDEVVELQRQLDEAGRRFDDMRDEARDEAYRANEEIVRLKSELDERREEVRRVRTRLSNLDREGTRQSVPPPGPDDGARLVEEARAEARVLRKQLIDAKRDLSRRSRELEELRSATRPREPRPRLDPPPSRPFGDSESGPSG